MITTCDAVRHSMWQCSLTMCAGSAYAEQWGNAHESPPDDDSARDQRNNAYGRSVSPNCFACNPWNSSLDCGNGEPEPPEGEDEDGAEEGPPNEETPKPPRTGDGWPTRNL